MRQLSQVAALWALVFLLAPAAPAADGAQVRETTSRDGVTIRYAEAGRGEPTIVFVHGWTCDRDYWAAQLPAFAEAYHVIAVDLAGHGESGSGRDDYSMASFGADVAAAVPGDGPVVLVGHSMGGPVILAAARQLGDRVVGLVAVDSLHDVSAPRPTAAQIQARSAPLKEDYEAVAGPLIEGMFVDTSDPALREAIISDMLATDRTVAIGAIRGMMRMDVRGAIKALDAPLVLINSTYVPTNFDAIAALHSDASIELMDGVGHFVMQEDPETFNRLLAEAMAAFTSS